MSIIRTPGRDRFAHLSGAAPTGRVTAEELGANAARQLGAFGQSLVRAGQAGMQVAIEKQQKVVEADANAKLVEAQKVGMSFRREATQATGSMATEAYNSYQQKFAQERDRIRGTIGSDAGKELFDKGMLNFEFHNDNVIQGHVSQQIEAGNKAAQLEEIKTLVDDVVSSPYDYGYMAHQLDNIRARVREYNLGAPEEAIERAVATTTMSVIEDVARNIMETSGPDAAMAFLASDVQKELFRVGIKPQPAKSGQRVAVTGGQATVSPQGEPEDEEAQYMQMSPVLRRQYQDLYGKLKKEFATAVEADAKKQSANRARDIGIKLGEAYDSDIEIERELYKYDKDIADIARVEATRISKARQAAGEGSRSQEMMSQARDIAATATTKADVYEAVDAMDNLSEKERKELRAEALTRFEVNESVRTAESKVTAEGEKELQAESVRVNADAIAGYARDESDIQNVTDNMDNVTEAYRKQVYETAVARLKVKNTRITREKAEAESQAMQTMEQAGWDVAAISPDWSSELQGKMRQLAGKNRTPDPLKALEYCDMTQEQLQKAVRDGEWPEISLHVKGISTEMYNQLAKKAFGDEASLKGARNVMQVGRDEFIYRTQISPSTREGQLSYANFIRQYEPALIQKARSLGLDDLNKVPQEDVNEVLKSLLEKGKYVDGVWSWTINTARDIAGTVASYVPFIGDRLGRSISSPDTFAFQVAGDPQRNMQYFTPNQPLNPSGTLNAGGSTISSNTALPSIAASSGGMRVSRGQVPSHAQQFISEGAEDIRLLDNDTVTFINRDGNMIIKEPGKPPLIAESLNPQRKTRQAADMVDDAWKELFDVVEYGGSR